MHPAVARARKAVDVVLLEAGVVEGTAKRLRFEHHRAQVRGDGPVRQPHADDAHGSLHGGKLARVHALQPVALDRVRPEDAVAVGRG